MRASIYGCCKQICKLKLHRPQVHSYRICDSTMQYASAKLFVLVITTILTTTGGCIPHERAGLLSFKQGITSDPNNLLGTWKGHSCCRWRGIKCSNRTGHVIKLHLRNDAYIIYIDDDYNIHKFGLSGKISQSLQSLDHLEHLDLSMNKLEEPNFRFPEFLCSLKSLRLVVIAAMSTWAENRSKVRHLQDWGFSLITKLGTMPIRT
nr:receptor-like protein EIX2 [Lolium perenne]